MLDVGKLKAFFKSLVIFKPILKLVANRIIKKRVAKVKTLPNYGNFMGEALKLGSNPIDNLDAIFYRYLTSEDKEFKNKQKLLAELARYVKEKKYKKAKQPLRALSAAKIAYRAFK